MKRWVISVIVAAGVLGVFLMGGYTYLSIEKRLKSVEAKKVELESKIQEIDKKLQDLDRKSKALSNLFETIRSDQQKLEDQVGELTSFGTDSTYDLEDLPPPPDFAGLAEPSPEQAAQCEDPQTDIQKELGSKNYIPSMVEVEAMVRKHVWDYYLCLQGLPSTKYK